MEQFGPLIGTLIGALATLSGGFLAHYSAEQRERANRQYDFRHEQFQKLYGPLTAYFMELQVQLRTSQKLHSSCLEKANAFLESHVFNECQPPTKMFTKPAYQFEEFVLERQDALITRTLALLQDNMHLAEPTTRKFYLSLLEYSSNRDAVRISELDIKDPQDIPAILAEFMSDVESQYNRLGQELRTAQFFELQVPEALLGQATDSH